MSNTRETSERDTSFDVLRAAAILYVVGFCHMCNYIEKADWIKHSSSAIELATACALGSFCFISGCVLSRRYVLKSWRDLGVFYLRRVLRIYPLYLIALTGFLSLGLIPRQLFHKSLFLTNALTAYGQDHLPTLWFVSMIVLFYTMAPLYLAFFKHWRAVAITLGIWAILVAINHVYGRIDGRFLIHFPVFAIGIIAGKSRQFPRMLEKFIGVVVSLVVFVGAVWISRHHRIEGIADLLITDVAILSSIPVLLFLSWGLSFVVRGRFLHVLSYSSFALYLFHRIIFEFGIRVHLWLWPESSVPSLAYMLALVVPASIAISYGIQWLYDKGIARIRLGT
jgi:peptidoglycan/LPS O-acetylase OafA/YrhL